jgi:fructan beta-fructosidase
LTKKISKLAGPSRLMLSADKISSFTLTLSNDAGEKLLVGFDKTNNSYFIDRSNSGKSDFAEGFAKRHTAPRLSTKEDLDLTLIIDNSSVELFADNGLSVMTEIFFPTNLFSDINIQSSDHFKINSLEFERLKSIWR